MIIHYNVYIIILYQNVINYLILIMDILELIQLNLNKLLLGIGILFKNKLN